MQRACNMLVHCLQENIRPTVVWAPIPVLMPGERSSTEWQPGKRLWAQLPRLNEQPGILDVSLLVGYVWADEPRATACAVVTGTAPAELEKIAISLAQQYWDARKEFQFGTETGTINECIERAMKSANSSRHPRRLRGQSNRRRYQRPRRGSGGTPALQSAECSLRRYYRSARHRRMLQRRSRSDAATLHRCYARSARQQASQSPCQGCLLTARTKSASARGSGSDRWCNAGPHQRSPPVS